MATARRRQGHDGDVIDSTPTRATLLRARGYPAEVVAGTNGSEAPPAPPDGSAPASTGEPGAQGPEARQGDQGPAQGERHCHVCGSSLGRKQTTYCSQECRVEGFRRGASKASQTAVRARKAGRAGAPRPQPEPDQLTRVVGLLLDAGAEVQCQVQGVTLVAHR